MHWFSSLMFLSAGCFLAHASVMIRSHNCLSADDLRDTWKEIDQLNTGDLFEECPLMDKSNLCEPAQIVEMVFSNSTEAAVQILYETAILFKKEGIPFPEVRDFQKYISARHYQVKDCLQQSKLTLSMNNSINECFQRLHVFLSQEDSHCAWQVVHMESMVILQRLEFELIQKLFQ